MNQLEAIEELLKQADRMLIDEMKDGKHPDKEKLLLSFASCSTAEAIVLVQEAEEK